MRLAVITGGARRIGAGITSRLLEEGWTVIIHCHNSVQQARQLLTKGQGFIVQGDLGSSEDLFRVIEEIYDHEAIITRTSPRLLRLNCVGTPRFTSMLHFLSLRV